MATKLLFLLTAAIAVVVGVLTAMLDPERLSAFGSIVAAGGSLVAVVWFSASLRYQAHQLDEQRKQFNAQFDFLKGGSKREALALAQGILERAETRAIAAFGGGMPLSDVPSKYMELAQHLKVLLESNDPQAVMNAGRPWIMGEGAATALLTEIQSAAQIYLESTQVTGIDYSVSPELFYRLHSEKFLRAPFFNSVHGTANLLAEWMFMLTPGRDAARIAYLSATAKTFDPDVVKMDKLQEDMDRHIKSGRQLPVIARDLYKPVIS